MKVDKKLLEKWKDLALAGDAERISESMPEDTRVTGQTIRTLIRTGEYRSLNVLEAVIAFYKERERKVKGLMNDALNDHENMAVAFIKASPLRPIDESNKEEVEARKQIMDQLHQPSSGKKPATNNSFLEKRRAAKSK